VLRSDHSIISVRPDGSDPIVFAEGDEVVLGRAQPTWSPDGGEVAWTEQIGEDSHELVIATADGVEHSRAGAPMLAQYLDWSPNGEAIAFMGNDFWGAMTLAFAETGADASIIDDGAPMYIDWNPDSESLLVHIEDRFEIIEMDGGARASIPTDGEFRVGTHVGGRIIYSVDGGGIGEVLTIADAGGQNPRALIRFTAPAAVVADDTTSRLALMSTWTREGVEIRESAPTDLPVLIPEQLVVLDLESGDARLVAEGRAVSWAWSPDGAHLLYSTVEFDGDSQRIVWYSWDGTTSTRYGVFTPSSRFGNGYLAFFDQHERSVTLWSPDSRAFVYAGGTAGAASGIWVQPVRGDAPVLVTEGIYATWSP